MTPMPWTHPIRTTPAIWHPTAPRDGWAVVWFRRRFTLKKQTRIWITASERFIACLDGKLLGRGPARSDPSRWACPEFSIGAGEHELLVCVFHFGPHAGMAQMGGPAFLLVCGAGEAWECREDKSRTPIDKHEWGGKGRYYVVGAGERIVAADDTGEWLPAKVVCRVTADEWGNVPLGHTLGADPLPAMEEVPVEFARTPARPWTVPAGQTARWVFDRGELTNAYPTLVVSGGRGATIQCVWAEAPYGSDHAKGNRDVTDGKRFFGHRDEFLPDGSARREFAPLWFRAFRYVEVTITTGTEPLTLEEFRLAFTGFPLRQRARFSAYRPLWEVSWRTARLCAHELLFDCPHYEQCQFPGDSVVQAVYHYLVANDDRLARKAMDDFRASQLPDGMIQCRYPSRKLQIIPTFALFWVRMLHDFRVYRGDGAFLRTQVPAARLALDWFARRRRADGMLGLIEYAPFMDWTAGFACGNAPQDADGGSALLTLLFAQACGWQADLERAAGFPALAPHWRRLARELSAATLRQCWDGKRGLIADTPARKSFSVHGQVFGVLAGLWPRKQAMAVLRQALGDATLTQPGTFYFRYYVAQALRATGLRAEFFSMLQHWERVLEGTGLTTWPESDSAQPRSDCHAWSVTPGIEFLQTVLGVSPDPTADGFARGVFTPTPGPLRAVSGMVPTPHGPVRVSLRGGQARVTTPIPLRMGRQVLRPGRHVVGVAGLRLGAG